MFRRILDAAGRGSLGISLTVCCLLNLLLLLVIGGSNPNYLRDARGNPNPDAADYVLLGRNVMLHGEYSRNPAPPFVPDVFRTPGYPLFAGLLDVVGGPLLLYLAQVGLHLLLCATLYGVARAMFDNRTAFVASLLIAINPTILTLNFQAMSEILYLALLCLFLLAVVRAFNSSTVSPPLYLVAGILLGLAILVRPAGLYLPGLVALCVFTRHWRPVGWRRSAWGAGSLLGGTLLFVLPWIARNQLVFQIPHLTTNDTVVLIYFTGAGGYQVHHGVEREVAQGMIVREFGIRPPEDMWNYHSRGLSPTEMDREARRVLFSVLRRHPGDLCLSCLIGLTKSFFSHDAALWAQILDTTWNAPGQGPLVRLDGAAWTRLLQNSPFLIGLFLFQLTMNVILVLFTVGGVAVALRKCANPSAVYFLLVLLLFFTLMCAASGIDAFTRFSAPILPFASLFSGYFIVFGAQRLNLLPPECDTAAGSSSAFARE